MEEKIIGRMSKVKLFDKNISNEEINKLYKEYKIRENVIGECIFWIKDWWAEGMPYGLKGIIKRLNKLKKYER